MPTKAPVKLERPGAVTLVATAWSIQIEVNRALQRITICDHAREVLGALDYIVAFLLRHAAARRTALPDAERSLLETS